MAETLFLLRHGVAEDAGPATGGRDEPRALTAAGALRMQAAARGIRALGIAPDAIFTSPLTRCRQTAEIVAAALGAIPRDDERLRPGMRLNGVEDVLAEHPGVRAPLLCGHQPDLSILVAELTGAGSVDFRKGSLAVLELASRRPPAARLRALYPPAALRLLGGESGPP